jgi:eukaryotic-like serine/threonine-protein kinase
VRSPTIAASDIFLLPLTADAPTERAPTRLTFENGYMYNPMWTPDGREILYVTYLDGSTVIKRVSVEGSGEPRVVFTVGQWGTSTALAPKDDRLVYAAAVEDLDIAVSSLPGVPERAEPAQRLISSTRTDMSPQISPDGTRIAFASRRSGPMEIWVADRDGANAVRLTPGLLYSGAPRWSPDGKFLVFGSILDGNDEIFTVSTSGGPVRRVTNDRARDVVASWSRDGAWIYFASNRTGTFQLWKVSQHGGAARQITKGGGYGGFESADGRYFYYAKNNGPTSLWRVAAEGGDEQRVLPSLHRWSHFAVFDEGIYFVPSIDVIGPSTLQFFDFASRTTHTVARIPAHTAPGLAIAPDRHWMLYVVHDRIASDLMLLEQFR